MKKLLLLATALLSLLPLSGIVITDNGKSQYVIAIPARFTRHEKQIADELSGVIFEMSGVKLPVRKESSIKAGTPRISVGNTALAKKNVKFTPAEGAETMVVKTVGNDLIITGSSQVAIQYAVYDFLTRFCDCDWFDMWNKYIPVTKKIAFDKIDYRRKPSFDFRRVFTLCRNWARFPTPMSVTDKATYNRVPRQAMGRPGDIHTFYLYTRHWPKDRLYLLSKNPQGRRNALLGQMGPNHCLTHPEAIDRFKKQLRGFIKTDRDFAKKHNIPQAVYYNISMNDCNTYFCYCDNCQAIVKKHGESGLMITFINHLANDIAKDYPDIWIHASAYSYAAPPPKGGVKPAPNVLVELSNNIGNYYEAVENDKTSVFNDYLNEWGRISKRLGIWDYWIFYWDAFPAPYHNVHFIKKNLKHYYNKGVRFIRIESEASDTANFYALKHWLGYKLMDDITLDDKELIDRFMKRFYGPAAPEMKEFMDYVAERQRGKVRKVFGEKVNDPDSRPWLDKAFYAKVQPIFDRAEAKCPKDSMYLKNVHRERIPVDLSLLYLYDKIKPAISRKDLAERYRAYGKEHIYLRKNPSAYNAELVILNNDVEKYINAEKINAMKNGPRPVWNVTSKETTKTLAYEVNGNPARLNAKASARYADGNLYLTLVQYNVDTKKLKNGKRVFLGDDWEIFLAPDRARSYAQFLISPKGQIEIVFRDKNGKEEWRTFPSVKVKSELEARKWTVNVTIPLQILPFKVKCGNIIRGIPNAGTAWSPTFGNGYRATKYFGDIVLK